MGFAIPPPRSVHRVIPIYLLLLLDAETCLKSSTLQARPHFRREKHDALCQRTPLSERRIMTQAIGMKGGGGAVGRPETRCWSHW